MNSNPLCDADVLGAARDLFHRMDDDQLLHAAFDARRLLASRAEVSADPRARSQRTLLMVACAMDAADIECRRVTGRPMRTTADYKRFAPSDAPSLATLYRNMGPTWRHVQAYTGAWEAVNPLSLNVDRVLREGDSAAYARPATDHEKDQTFAYVVEACAGRRPSREQFEMITAQRGPGFLTFEDVLTREDGPLTMEECYERVKAMVADNPGSYKLTERYLARQHPVS